MKIMLFLYNILLIILYTCASVYSINLYNYKKKPVYICIFLLFLLYILNDTVIYTTEFFSKFSSSYNIHFITVPTLKTLVVISIALLYFVIQKQVLKTKFNIIDYGVLVSFAAYLLIMPLFLDGAIMVWCYYLSHQLVTIYISYTGLKYIKNNANQFSENDYIDLYKKLLTYTLIFSFLIVIEDSIVIPYFDVYSNLLVNIHNRNFSEDILRIIFAVSAIKYFSSQFSNKNAKEVENNTVCDNSMDNSCKQNYTFYEFVRCYNLTTREEDILRYILQNKNNQEISDMLFISIGTVKTHIHNIFQKVDVNKRNMLISKYRDFSNEFDESQESL